MADRIGMHEMDCENCANGKQLPAGTYRTVNGATMICDGRTITCTNHSIRQMSIVGDRMYCSDYKEKES